MAKLTAKEMEKMLADHTAAININIDKCDFCGGKAEYDAATKQGPWAGMCEKCWQKHGRGQLGLGKGQRLLNRKDVPKSLLKIVRKREMGE